VTLTMTRTRTQTTLSRLAECEARRSIRGHGCFSLEQKINACDRAGNESCVMDKTGATIRVKASGPNLLPG
jgi:Fe-S cluster assembly iron-binding protein IscA